MENADDKGPGPLSRRRLLAAAAWTTPAIVLGPALPAFAYTPPDFEFEFTGAACKYPGNSGPFRKAYRFGVTSSHNAPNPVVLVVRSFTVNGVSAPIVQFLNISPAPCGSSCPSAGGLAQICIPSGTPLTYDLVAGPYQDSENGLAEVVYDLYNGDTCEAISTGNRESTLPNSLPPC